VQRECTGRSGTELSDDECHRTKKTVKMKKQEETKPTKHKKEGEREDRDAKQDEVQDTKQKAVEKLTYSDIVGPPSSTSPSMIRAPVQRGWCTGQLGTELSDDEEERPGTFSMPGYPQRRDGQQMVVPVEESPIEATIVIEEGAVTEEARDRIAAEVRHQLLQEACIATSVRGAAEEDEESNDIRHLKPLAKLACAVAVMIVVIICVVLGVLFGRDISSDLPTDGPSVQDLSDPPTEPQH
jgi:hypothetical protein